MFQIVFNAISAAEISRLATMEQLDLLNAFRVSQKDLEEIDNPDSSCPFGKIKHRERTLYRFRTDDYRIYFEVDDKHIIVHRLLHKNSLTDFLFRSKLVGSEDEQLAESKHFWKLIEEGKNAEKKTL